MDFDQCINEYATQCGQSDGFLLRCATRSGVSPLRDLACGLCGANCGDEARINATIATAVGGGCAFAQLTHRCSRIPVAVYDNLIAKLTKQWLPVVHIDAGVVPRALALQLAVSLQGMPPTPAGFAPVGIGCCRLTRLAQQTTLRAIPVSDEMSFSKCSARCLAHPRCDAFEFNAIGSCGAFDPDCSARCWFFQTHGPRKLAHRLVVGCADNSGSALQFCFQRQRHEMIRQRRNQD